MPMDILDGMIYDIWIAEESRLTLLFDRILYWILRKMKENSESKIPITIIDHRSRSIKFVTAHLLQPVSIQPMRKGSCHRQTRKY